ncbi:mucin-3B [Channa argus]|uniref:mucin-3B n=1 Tax=Channa argus TaxID=215402 RepID=UPI003520C144
MKGSSDCPGLLIPDSVEGCKILSVRASGPSSILVKWEVYTGAASYFLDLRVVNNTNVVPVVVSVPSSVTEKDVQGLRPGTEYTVTFKVFQFLFSSACVVTTTAWTVPDTSQIEVGQPLTSTSIYVKWSQIPSTQRYYLLVRSQATGLTFNLTYTNTSTTVENLQPSTNYDCYVYTANQGGLGFGSKVRTITTLVQPPVNITATQTSRSTARVTWQPVKEVLIYRVVIQSLDDPTSKPSVHNVTDTKMDAQGIFPCSTYLISVSSLSKFLVPSEATVYTYSTNKLTPVSTVSVDYTCTDHAAWVSWSAVFGADSYKATATSNNGTQLTCSSQTDSCQITGLSCGLYYVVSVTPISGNCQNVVTTTSATFQTVACPPKKLELFRNCSSEVIIFSWEPTNNTDFYEATAVDSKGEVQECVTIDSVCYFTHTVCGRHYYFTVSAVTGECSSQSSSSVDIQTAPCIPQNLQTSADCRSDVMISKWDLAEGALSYTVEAFGNRGSNSHYNCSSVSNSCAIEGIQCGESLTIFITAYDDECASPKALGPVAETAPCTPQNVVAVKECGADSITLTWDLSGGAIFYVGLAKDSNGIIHNCNSFDLTCNIAGLKCSTNYRVHVIASNFVCNSTESRSVSIETAACPPENVTASLDCTANEVLISWHGQPTLNSYTATIVDENQGLLSCSSTTTSCRVPNLTCGKLYALTVCYHDGICPCLPSKAIYFDSVPCGPANTQASVDCATGGLTIGWNATRNAEGYITVISNNNGQNSYNTTQPTLKIDTLECGLQYSVTVMSFNRSCVSFPTIIPVKEAPCVPTNVVVTRNCGQSFVELAWQESSGARNYTATAAGKDGSHLICVSNTTSCRLDGLTCSQVYNVSVVAVDDACTSVASLVVKHPTAPCPPSQLTVSVNCTTNSALLTWNSSINAVSYTGKAVAADSHIVTCDAGASLSCELQGLHCGMEYTFTVAASDGNCHSPDSSAVIQTTAPCAVQNVINTLNCSSNILTVSWTPRLLPVSYSVSALDRSGTVLHCTTQGSSCMLTNLLCGQQYTVMVKAISSTCEGQSSFPQTVNSAPCVPVNIQGVVACSTNTLQASWDAAPGGVSYISTLKGPGDFSTSCLTSDQRCLFSGLQCAHTYTFSVIALNDRCNSSDSGIISATTAPCDPTNVAAVLNCLTGVVTVTWGSSPGANNYTVLAETNRLIDSCNSNGNSCQLSQLHCGEDYTVTVLAGDGKCNSSILAKTYVTTAPCAPVIQNNILDCTSNRALVTWVEDKDALSVTVNANSSLGHLTSCSSSTNTSCVLADLHCGNTYTVQAVSRGGQCLSKPSSTFQIVTAPCTPAHVESTYSCESGIAVLSWDETLGRKSFYALIQSGNITASCSTSQTDCSLSSLLCGLTYNVKVIAVADQCNSSVPGVSQLQTGPCAPVNVSASLVCDNNTAAVSWQPSSGATFYKVTALGRNGDVKECTTSDTSCNIPNLFCAQTYVITVSPYSNVCKGTDSYPYNYLAGPCPPTDINVSLQCAGNVGYVTWTPALQADFYVVRAVDEHLHSCTSNGTSCSLTDLTCGERSVVTVVTVERGCRSKPSLPFTFHSVICPPTNVTGVTNCKNSDITVTWDPSPRSHVNYFLYSQENAGASASYTTNQTSYVITGLQCSKLYTFTVAARDGECTSVISKPIQTKTAPCPPTNLTASADCGTNMGTLTWALSAQAISYTATMTGTHGPVVSCSSNTTTCSAKLDCGHQYSAIVLASSAMCNSSSGATLTFQSAPCLPDRVTAELDCNVNSFAVQWSASIGEPVSYTAMAISSSNGTSPTCNSTSTNCTIHNLQCGLTYSIAVTTSSINCETIVGSDFKMLSAPCKPNNVLVNLKCSTNVATVTWGNSGRDQNEVVSAVDSRGGISTCNARSSNCTFNNLICGESYIISVVAYTNSCTSEPVMAQKLQTAPCVPTHLTAQVGCQTGITTVTWDVARGATSYTAYARGNLGYKADCNTTETYCDFPNLACGQDYNITVVAHHDSCDSLVSESITATTGPCPQNNLKTALDCNTNTALVSWTPGRGILYYNATADALSIVQQHTCSTNGSSCNISSLSCGTSYRVSVSGQGQNCPSPAQEWNIINTAPCPPTKLRIDSSCESNNITVLWQASQGSVSYTAVAENAQGHQWSCNTRSTSCQIYELLCGQEYHVYVVGVDGSCIGAKSNTEVIRIAPCVPQQVHYNLDCLSGALNITWQSTGYFVQFRASAASSKGHVSGCTTNSHYCTVPNLNCDTTYNVTVVAEDNNCNSSQSLTKQVLTAPCTPSSFLPNLNCSSGILSVTWNSPVAEVVYTVSAVSTTDHQHNCNSTNGSCDLNALKCGKQYDITITPSRNGCVGTTSSTQVIKTVPCVPKVSEVEIDCLTNSAWLMYNESAGAENYFAIVTDRWGNVQTFDCNSTSNGICTLPELECSQNLTFTLEAHNEQCPSAPSNAVTTETAPCPPKDVRSLAKCDNNTISIMWPPVPGAVTYTATLEQLTGKITCCTSSGTGCDITNLPCGEMYVLLVTAEGRTCNSSQSKGDIVRTAPCVPKNLKANVSCTDNVASMSWNLSKGGQLYEVRAVSTDGHEDQCVSFDGQCDLTGLHCGQHYTVTVTAEDIHCKSKPSDSVTIRTVPCTPASISSVVNCMANTLIVSWSESSGADSYIATVQDSNGQTTTCQATTEGSCNVTGLGCGQIYHAFVVSSDGYCNSLPTSLVDTPSVPCEPRNIQAMFDCDMQTAMVTWYPSDGALSYVVTLTTASGPNITCETNTTFCNLEGLLCGHSYTVSVKAVGWTCSRVGYFRTHLVTGSCSPQHITVEYSLSIGQVQWDTSAGAGYYTVEGVTEEGHTVSCITNDTSCALYNLGCGQSYSIHVMSNNQVCQGVATSNKTVIIRTEPCPPNNVEASLQCQSDTGTVSWEASFGSVGYKASLAGRDGHSLSCNTNETFCTVNGLHCGVVYHTNVISIGETVNSSSSTTFLLPSAPCAVENVVASVDCKNASALISWSSARGASSYLVTAAANDGQQASCETDGLHCELTDLVCGQTYAVSLITINEQCQTETQTNVRFSTTPCIPFGVDVDLQCGTSTANVHWEEREGVELYLATGSNGLGETLFCNSTNSTCQFSNLRCGEAYKFSVTAYSNRCFSEISDTLEIQTEPCQPTGLTVDGSCNNDTVVVHWSAASGALVYVVTVTGNLGYVTDLQTDQTAIGVELVCGQLFTFTVKAQDDKCDSAISAPERFKTGPCVPQNVQSFTHCENNLGSVRWAKSDGAESYLVIAKGHDDHTHVCTTNTTSCSWNDLHCGENYTVHVIANDHLCNSIPSNQTFIRMAPCIPQNLKSSLNCTIKVASLTWNASETAEFYTVTAETTNGSHKLQLSTNETRTFISEFQCGQDYFLSVQAVDSVCTSLPSQPSKLTSQPCLPTRISSFVSCLSNIAVVSWTGSAGALFYTATVTQGDGQSKSCWSDNEQCGMPNINCGQNYSVTVIASNKQCDSDPSKGNTLQSVPCVPTNVDVEIDCSRNQAVVSWNASEGAVSYKVTAQSTQGAVASCGTTDHKCTLMNLTCGQSYSVQVVAQDNICSSLPSPAINFKSVPCKPNIDAAVLDCFTNSALLEWSQTEGALYYTSTARSSSGHVSTCNANITNCELENLQCGQTYNVIVVASNEKCSSPPSTRVQVNSVPCPPQNVVPVLNCSTNTAQVAWQASRGADSYIVQAFAEQGHETGCKTGSQSCSLTDLICGFTYNISVIAVNSVCNVSESDIKVLQAVPCVPQQVEARVDCENGSVAVSWEPSTGSLSYTTIAQGNGGYASTCNSNDTTCLFNHLLCSLNYSITVHGSDNTCSSAESSAVKISTVPCVPQKVRAQTVCNNDSGVVSWEKEEGVSSYIVQAFGPDGHKTKCGSTATSCQLPDLHCGQLYNLTVTAQDGRCDNSNAYLSLQSVPCRPTYVKASLECQSDSAAVTWEPASGAVSYLAVGVTADRSQEIMCNDTLTQCDLRNLVCGQIYSVSVFSHDESCSSAKSDEAYVQTAPCPPQNVTVTSQCAESAMSVSWSPSPDAQYFHVVALSNTGARLYCNSTSTTCAIKNLPCGQEYDITVQSVRDGCNSKLSTMVHTSSAPCVPRNIKGRLDCISNSVWVTWDNSDGALSYFVYAQGAKGHNSSCTTTSSTCRVPDLKCGTLYTFRVTAVNKYCKSNDNATFDLETGPCALSSLSTVTQCNSDTILVQWQQTMDMPLYVVTAEGNDQTLISCNSSSNSCALEGVRCGTQYSIIVSVSSDKCSSLRSPPATIKTAPCVPDNVTVVQLCEVNGAAVTWRKSFVAISYHLTATGSDGHVASCSTSVNNCTLADLHCGQPYYLSITASGDNCTSQPSTSSFRTVPCNPSGVSVDTDCNTNSATLSWDATEGALQYYGQAQSINGSMLYCHSNASSCIFEGLKCGDIFNFSVKASNSNCNTSFSPPLTAGAVPCPPAVVRHRMQYMAQSYWVRTTWDSVNCSDVEYLVEITGRIKNNPHTLIEVSSYWLPRRYYEFPLPCSTVFNLTVRSRNSAGVGKPSSALTGLTAPCAPENVKYSGSNDSAVLFWDASVFATSYTVYSVSAGSRIKLCNTSSLSCTLTNFNSSATEVTASNAVGESNPNQHITGSVGIRARRDLWATEVYAHLNEDLKTPELQTVTVSGVSLYVKWTMVKGANEYTLVIEEEEKPNQQPIVKTLEGDFYQVKDLKPRTTYCIRIAARNAMNQSSYSRPMCRTSGAS